MLENANLSSTSEIDHVTIVMLILLQFVALILLTVFNNFEMSDILILFKYNQFLYSLLYLSIDGSIYMKKYANKIKG